LPELTMLNSMASRDLETALNRLREWGIQAVDLKDCIFDKAVLDLSPEEAERAAAMIGERGQYVYCLSTNIFQDDIEQGEESFRECHERLIERALFLASILKPKIVRVLSVQSSKRHTFSDSTAYLEARHPWVFDLYRSAARRFYQEGVIMTIENDPHLNVFGSPEEISGFFERLNVPGMVHFTLDVQNLWQMGVFPKMEIYSKLKPLIGYLHVKGGIMDPATKELKWKSSLEDASWPVAEMCKQAAADGVSPVICLNPSHGEWKPGYDYRGIVEKDLKFLRSIFE